MRISFWTAQNRLHIAFSQLIYVLLFHSFWSNIPSLLTCEPGTLETGGKKHCQLPLDLPARSPMQLKATSCGCCILKLSRLGEQVCEFHATSLDCVVTPVRRSPSNSLIASASAHILGMNDIHFTHTPTILINEFTVSQWLKILFFTEQGAFSNYLKNWDNGL
jgi:hypothetical protein